MIGEWEGRDCRIPITLHRTMMINEFEITTHYDMEPVRTLDGAIYHLENKWYPDFNDEPLGDDFDYSTVKIVREWITGPFETYESDISQYDK